MRKAQPWWVQYRSFGSCRANRCPHMVRARGRGDLCSVAIDLSATRCKLTETGIGRAAALLLKAGSVPTVGPKRLVASGLPLVDAEETVRALWMVVHENVRPTPTWPREPWNEPPTPEEPVSWCVGAGLDEEAAAAFVEARRALVNGEPTSSRRPPTARPEEAA